MNDILEKLLSKKLIALIIGTLVILIKPEHFAKIMPMIITYLGVQGFYDVKTLKKEIKEEIEDDL